jgi:hypothetical protein
MDLQVELLFAMSTFMQGSRQSEVQQRLARFGLVSTLDRLFDRLTWEPPTGNHTAPHGPSYIPLSLAIEHLYLYVIPLIPRTLASRM